VHYPCIVAQFVAQTRQFTQRPDTPQHAPGRRELEAVDPGKPRRLLRHQGADDIIAEKPSQNKAMPEPRQLVLASTSRYRRELLARLALPFDCADPGVAEQALPGEACADTAQRLAGLKASAVAARFPQALIIGADQVASCDGAILGKPGTHANAARQLNAVSGKTARFDTALALLDARSGLTWERVVVCQVHFRRLSSAQIEEYLRREQPYDCAGSAKSEGLGIALIARIEGDDPTALVGLPLIALSEMLAQAGMPVLRA
jgi:septum formation protein